MKYSLVLHIFKPHCGISEKRQQPCIAHLVQHNRCRQNKKTAPAPVAGQICRYARYRVRLACLGSKAENYLFAIRIVHKLQNLLHVRKNVKVHFGIAFVPVSWWQGYFFLYPSFQVYRIFFCQHIQSNDGKLCGKAAAVYTCQGAAFCKAVCIFYNCGCFFALLPYLCLVAGIAKPFGVNWLVAACGEASLAGIRQRVRHHLPQ